MSIRFDYELDDTLQWHEYDATVIGADRESGYVTIECHETNGDSFTVNIPDSGRQLAHVVG